MLVKDINPGSGASLIVNSNHNDRVVKDGVLYFAALNTTHGNELWRSDGTAAGTFVVKDIFPGASHGLSLDDPTSLVNVNGTLFFAANDGVTGFELWATDGTPGGTTLVGDIASGILNSSPFNLIDVNGVLMFGAWNGTTTSLWRSDGTTANTQPVANVGMFSRCRIVFGGLLYFAGLQTATGAEF